MFDKLIRQRVADLLNTLEQYDKDGDDLNRVPDSMGGGWIKTEDLAQLFDLIHSAMPSYVDSHSHNKYPVFSVKD